MPSLGHAAAGTTSVGGRRLDEARRLRDLLRYELCTYPPQDLGLSDERSLALRLGGSRNALRQALQLLRDERIVDRRPRLGTVVVAQPGPAVESEFEGLAREISDGRSRVRYEVISFREVAPIASVSHLLEQPAVAPLYLLSRLTAVDDRPACIWDTYFRGSESSRISAQLRGEGRGTPVETRDFFELVSAALGTDISTLSMRVEAVLADEPCSRILDVPVGSPLLRFERVVHDTGGRALALSFGRGRPDQIAIAVHHRRAQPSASWMVANDGWGAETDVTPPLGGAGT